MMNFVKGDKVIVIAGKDKGTVGTIQKVDPKGHFDPLDSLCLYYNSQ